MRFPYLLVLACSACLGPVDERHELLSTQPDGSTPVSTDPGPAPVCKGWDGGACAWPNEPPPGGFCTIAYHLDGLSYGGFTGTSACPRSGGGRILKVRSSENSQSHCSQMMVMFSPEPDDLSKQYQRGIRDPMTAWFTLIAHGPGRYTTREDCRTVTCIYDGGFPVGAPAGQPTLAVEARHRGMHGTGTVDITSDAHLDTHVLKGTVDIAFPDGCRLYADFEAPLTSTE